MALDIDCHRHAGDVSRQLLHEHVDDSGGAAQSCRSDTQVVAAPLDLILELSQPGVGIGRPYLAQQGVFGHIGRLLERASQTHAHDDGGTRVGTRLAHRAHDEIYGTLATLGRLQHAHGAHVLGAAPFGCHDHSHPVAGHDARVQHGGGVVTGVLACSDRIGHGRLAQIAFSVAAAHSFVDRSL
jgi:hypothetical protein